MSDKARIYRPDKNAMQSGTAKSTRWILEFEPKDDRFIEHIMGWTGNGDTGQQVRLTFVSKQEAIRYADKHGLAYQLFEPHRRQFKAKSYADNFAYNKVDAYRLTHESPRNSA